MGCQGTFLQKIRFLEKRLYICKEFLHHQNLKFQKNMIRSLLKLAFWAIVVMVIYNYFWGSPTEKAQSGRVFQGVGQLFGEIKSLVVSEKGKFDGGKYDVALDKMGNVITKLREHGNQTGDKALIQQSVQLEDRRQHIGKQLENTEKDMKTGGETSAKLQQAANLARELERLNIDLQGLVEKVSPGASKK